LQVSELARLRMSETLNLGTNYNLSTVGVGTFCDINNFYKTIF